MGSVNCLENFVLKIATIAQFGQRVMGSLPGQPSGNSSGLAHGAEHENHARHFIEPVT